jgi:xanthine dehydrogenase accessory factor
MRNDLVLIRGGGRVGTAVAHRLRLCGFPVVVTEAARPTMLRRRASFGAAVYESEIEVESVPARRAANPEGLKQILEDGVIPVLVDPPAVIREALSPWVLVDAIGLSRNIGTRLTDAPIVVGLGAGFMVGRDVHVLVETRAGADLGRVIREGGLVAETPGGGWPPEASRVLGSPAAGRFSAAAGLGDPIKAGGRLGDVGGTPVESPVDGLVVGLLMDGLFVGRGIPVAEVDPAGDSNRLGLVDPLSRAVAGGVVEAIFYTAAVGAAPGQALSPET